VFEPGRSAGGGMVLQAAGITGNGPVRRDLPGAATSHTDEGGKQQQDLELEDDVDATTLARVQQIASRLALRRPRTNAMDRRGSGDLASVRYSGGSDEIDLDATLDQLVEHPVPDDDDIIVRERRRSTRSVVLAIDVSGSMRGERVRTAAATIGALVPELADDALAVIAFWSDAAVLAPLARGQSGPRVLETLLRIPARGLTNVSFPLELAARQLAGVPHRDARVLLLSDCVHNAGPDPRIAAGRLPRLDVLLDTSGEHDAPLATDLARVGHGLIAQVKTHRDVAPALGRIFAT
jgi:Mg-chelatase subunit ChlD